MSDAPVQALASIVPSQATFQFSSITFNPRQVRYILTMHSLHILLTLLFALTTTSYAWPSISSLTLSPRNDNSNSSSQDSPLKTSCKKIRKLTILSDLATNQTKLDTWLAAGKLTTAEIDALKAKAANATAELQTLQSNNTLVSECAAVNAERKSIRQCKQLRKLTKLAALAENATALSALEQKKGLNETGIEALKAKIADASTKLQTLQANATLTSFCAQRQQQKSGDADTDTAAGAGAVAEGTTAGSAQQATNGAAGLTAQTMPYVVVPALAAVFTFFL